MPNLGEISVSNTFKKFVYRGAVTTTATTAVYTVPADGASEVLYAQFSNLDGSNAVDVSVAIVPEGATYGAGTYDVLTAKTIAAKGVDNTSINGLPVEPGDAIHLLASANGDARVYMWTERERGNNTAY